MKPSAETPSWRLRNFDSSDNGLNDATEMVIVEIRRPNRILREGWRVEAGH